MWHLRGALFLVAVDTHQRNIDWKTSPERQNSYIDKVLHAFKGLGKHGQFVLESTAWRYGILGGCRDMNGCVCPDTIPTPISVQSNGTSCDGVKCHCVLSLTLGGGIHTLLHVVQQHQTKQKAHNIYTTNTSHTYVHTPKVRHYTDANSGLNSSNGALDWCSSCTSDVWLCTFCHIADSCCGTAHTTWLYSTYVRM